MSLRTIILLKICHELRRSVRKPECLRLALKILPILKYLLLCGLVLKSHKHSRGMTVCHGHTDALRRDEGSVSLYYLAVLHLTPNAKRLLLGLLFLAAYVRDNIVYHFGPLVKRLARTRYCLIRGSYYLFYSILAQRGERRNIGLYRTVRLNCDKASLCSESLSL